MRDMLEDRIIINSIIECIGKTGYTIYPHSDSSFSIKDKILEKINESIKDKKLYAAFRISQSIMIDSDMKKNDFCICEENDTLRFGGHINYYSNGSNDDRWSSYYVTISIWPVIHHCERSQIYEFDIND